MRQSTARLLRSHPTLSALPRVQDDDKAPAETDEIDPKKRNNEKNPDPKDEPENEGDDTEVEDEGETGDDSEETEEEAENRKKSRAIAERIVALGAQSRNEPVPTSTDVRQPVARTPRRLKPTTDQTSAVLAILNMGRKARGLAPLSKLPRGHY